MQVLGLTVDQWIDVGLSALIVLGAALIGRWLVNLLLGRFASHLAKRTSSSLDDTIIQAVRIPLYLLIVFVALKIAIVRLDVVPASWDDPLDSIFFVLNLSVGFIFAWRLIHSLFDWYGQEMAMRTKTDLDEQLMPFFRRLVLILLGIIGLIVLLGRFDVDVSALVTTLGVGSLAIALAAQVALSDTISGFIIMIDRPFSIGDNIKLPSGEKVEVLDIGIRRSKFIAEDKAIIIMPNLELSKSKIVNYTQ